MRGFDVVAVVAVVAVGRIRAAAWTPWFADAPAAPFAYHYEYAPSGVWLNASTWAVFYCANNEDDAFRDAARFRVGSVAPGGSVRISAEILALAASSDPSAFDSWDVCDPEVVSGSFALDGSPFLWAMLYTGADPLAPLHNQIGLAFARDDAALLAGQWTRLSAPLVPFTTPTQWGVGQPSAWIVNSGVVMLSYTRGDGNGTRVVQRRVDLSRCVSQPPAGSPPCPYVDAIEVPVPLTGLETTSGAPETFLNNAALTWNPAANQTWMIREGHPYPTGAQPTYISAAVQVAFASGSNDNEPRGAMGLASERQDPSPFIRSPWTVQGDVGSSDTAWPRNHNPGWLRARDGTVSLSSDASDTAPSEAGSALLSLAQLAATSPQGRSEWTYRLAPPF